MKKATVSQEQGKKETEIVTKEHCVSGNSKPKQIKSPPSTISVSSFVRWLDLG